MRSSTSSSEAGLLRALRLLLQAAAAPVATGACLVALVTLLLPPGSSTHTIEDVIVETQLARAARLPPARVLVVGDSSGLMGIDPVHLGNDTESIAMIGFVGPRGLAGVLDRVKRSPGTLLVAMNPVSLSLSKAEMQPWEARVHGSVREEPLARAREAMFSGVLARVVELPLPGAYGRSFGWPDDMARAIDGGHGGLIDPSSMAACATPPRAISEAVRERLPELRVAIKRLAPGRAYIVVTPSPSECAGASFDDAHAAMLRELGQELEIEPLHTRPTLPAALFSTRAHLSAQGRASFTEELAVTLAKRPE